MLTAKLYIDGKEVGGVDIVNVTGNGTGRISSDYYWRLKCQPLDGQEIKETGLIVDSYNGDAMECLAEVLMNWVKRDNSGEAYDNHGNLVTKSQSRSETPAEYWEKYDKWNKLPRKEKEKIREHNQLVLFEAVTKALMETKKCQKTLKSKPKSKSKPTA